MMTTAKICAICRNELADKDRVIYSHRSTFVFKPADVEDPEVFNEKGLRVNLAATLAPDALRELRKDHMRTAIVNTFVTWGQATIPLDAYYFRHQGCDPIPTGAGGNQTHPLNKHMIRFRRSANLAAMRKR